MHRIIDWNELWKAIHASSPEHAARDRDPAAVWTNAPPPTGGHPRREGGDGAGTRSPGPSAGGYRARRGAGTGRLAVPIARIVAHV